MATRINLLPWREELRKEKNDRFIFQLLCYSSLAFSVFLYGLFFVNGQLSHQERRNRYLEDQIAALDRDLQEIEELERTKQGLLSRMKIVQQLQTRRPQTVHLLYDIAAALPDGITLSWLRQEKDRIVIGGMSESNARVSAYMRNLDRSNWMTDPKLEVIETSNGAENHSFTLELKQDQPD